MTRYRGRRVGRPDTVSLAGWLLADLLLGLAMLFFVFNTVGPEPATPPTPLAQMATHTPTRTHTPTLTPVATSTFTPDPTLTITPTPEPTASAGLEIVPMEVWVHANADILLGPAGESKNTERERLQALIREQFGNMVDVRHAGFVLIWGYGADAREGNILAAEILPLLDSAVPQVFAGAARKELHWILSEADLGQRGMVRLEVYLFVEVK